MSRAFKLLTVIMIVWALCEAPEAQAQGFSNMLGGKKEATLKRKLAPYVNIKNKRIKIIAEAQGNTPKDIAEVLKTKFVTDVQKDLGYIVDEANPETILKFTVTTFDAEVKQGTRQSGSNTLPFTLVNGNVEVSYQALEAQSNAPLDSENLVESFKKEYSSPISTDSAPLRKIPIFGGIPTPTPKSAGSSAAPSQSELRNNLINGIVKQMAQRAALVEENFPVKLPKGKLEDLSKVALTQSWGKVLEGAESMEPLPKEKDDSYRHYLIGLANEALAYEQTTNEATRDYLFRARKAYDDARTKYPGEEEYIQPWTRVDKALSQYEKIKRQAEEYRNYLASKKVESKSPAPVQGAQSNSTLANSIPSGEKSPDQKKSDDKPAASGGGSGGNEAVWDNQMVIKIWKQGNVTEQRLGEFVKNAPTHKFDPFSAQGVLELTGAGVPQSVIDAMIQKVKPQPQTPVKGKSSQTGAKKPKGN
jgi:hypothetical protein